eukprot:snap_masked-scaffold_11-processed-gene-4.22-mRNA-1 protein AED:1.00 eAED:1.00 QI:0/-1/0/0/-1/1/1/0/69
MRPLFAKYDSYKKYSYQEFSQSFNFTNVVRYPIQHHVTIIELHERFSMSYMLDTIIKEKVTLTSLFSHD